MKPIRTYFTVTFLACLILDMGLMYGIVFFVGPANPLHFRPDAPALWLGGIALLTHAFLSAWTRDNDELPSYPFLRSLLIVIFTLLMVCLLDAAYLGWIMANNASALVISGNWFWGFVAAWTAYVSYVGKAIWVLALELQTALFSGSIPTTLKLSYAAFLGAAWFWTLLILHGLRVLRVRELSHIGRPENEK